MEKIMFDAAKELEVIGYYPGPKPQPILNTPILPKENLKMALAGQNPLWIATAPDMVGVSPICVPDNKARGFVSDVRPLTAEEKGGLDMFGLDWEFVAVTGGSIVRPGEPLLADANEWKEKLAGRIPNPDDWAWEETAARILPTIDDRRMRKSTIFTGFFERLISFMDFSNAILALIDDEQKDAVHEIFDMLCGVYIKIIDNLIKYFNIELLELHDDWGSQRAPLFGEDTIREMIAPYIKRVFDYCHAHGVATTLHSCGKIEDLVPVMVDCGADMWVPQVCNDIDYVIKTYGDQIVIGINPDKLEPGLSEEEIRAKARGLVAKYKDTPRVFLFKSPSRHTTPDYEAYFNEVYCESRRLLSE